MNPARVINRHFLNHLTLPWPLMTRANPPTTTMRILGLPTYISVILANIADTRNPTYRDLKRLESQKWKHTDKRQHILDVIHTINQDTKAELDWIVSMVKLKPHILKKQWQYTALDLSGLTVSALSSNIPTMVELSDIAIIGTLGVSSGLAVFFGIRTAMNLLRGFRLARLYWTVNSSTMSEYTIKIQGHELLAKLISMKTPQHSNNCNHSK